MTDSARRIPSGSAADGWTQDAATWTRTANTTFTVTGDRTSEFSKGTRIKVVDTTTKYFVVVASSHSSGTTTVTITGGTDYSLAANPTTRWYSYAANPQGYPRQFNYTPTLGGFSANPSSVECGFSVVGGVCTFNYRPNTQGTSNATTFTMTLPVLPAESSYTLSARLRDNGTDRAQPGLLEWIAANGTMSIYLDGQGLGWTASGGKWAQFCFSYLI